MGSYYENEEAITHRSVHKESNNNNDSECNSSFDSQNPLPKYVLKSPKNADYFNYIDKHPSAKVIGINGLWYDVTNFISRHPGGPVIGEFAGKDATEVFAGFHERDVIAGRKPVGEYDRDLRDPVSEEFAKLHKYFKNNGYFNTSMSWYAIKTSITFAKLLIAIVLVTCFDNFWLHMLGAISLTCFWQECGFFMHDYMHNQVFHSRVSDQWCGTFFASACFGVCGLWWRDEHFIHHALTNTVDVGRRFVDPQMWEPVWCQNVKMLPLFQRRIQRLLMRIQHITFLPVCILIGRIGIVVDSFSGERRLREWVAFAIHWTWVSLLLSQLPTWTEVFLFYGIASVLEGILHIQLLISHYCKPFYYHPDICENLDWYRMQIESNINISCPVWMDWFHGGLNFHIEHHLYPTMPRHNYRRASAHVRAACQRAGVEYDTCGWLQAVSRTLTHLKTMSTHYSLDPR